MVWRKNKKVAVVADSGRSAALLGGATSLAGVSPGGSAVPEARNSQTSTGGPDGAALGELSPQNIDMIQGAWRSNAKEFRIPVRSREGQRAYTIPRNYRITGNLSSTRRVVIDGEFAGGVLDAPTVTVTAGGCLRGSVNAGNLQVAGMVDANVLAQDALEVSERGTLAGHIRAPQIQVWPGAVLHGATLTVGGQKVRQAEL